MVHITQVIHVLTSSISLGNALCLCLFKSLRIGAKYPPASRSFRPCQSVCCATGHRPLPLRKFLSQTSGQSCAGDLTYELHSALYGHYDAALVALQSLEEDISRSIRKFANGIQCAMNSQRPILKLPVEVARRIFAFLDGNIRDQMSVAQTCSLWRTVITEDPFLWTTIDMDTVNTPQVASKAFRSAKDYPLRMKCRHWDEFRLQCVALEMHRVEELETIFTVPSFRTLCRIPAPSLKRFVIASGVTVYGYMHAGNDVFTYLPYLFSNTHPLLTDLTMIDCRLAITPENYRGLTKLNIRFSFPIMSLRYDEDFMCVLRGSPNLEELRLENMIIFREHQIPMDVIDLPYLRTMHVRLVIRDLRCILSAISAPPTLRLSVSPIYKRDRTSDPSLLAQIALPVPPSLSLLEETAYLDVDPSKHGIFTYRDTAAEQPAWSYRAAPLQTIINTDPAGEALSADLLVLADLHPMPLLERVRTRDIEPSVIVKLLGKCPSVTDVELMYPRRGIGNTSLMPTIMSALRTSTEPFLPNLQTMRIQEVYIDVDTIFDILELRRACPDFQNIFMYSCEGDLPVEEMLEILQSEFENAKWIEQHHYTDHNYRHQPAVRRLR